jgi:hypothetical protein
MSAGLSVQSQDTAAVTRALNIFRRVQMKSLEKPVSFEMSYTYTNEHTPEEILDSLRGKVEMSGENYRCLLDQTETIRNGKYNIVLFKEDKLMYLTSAGKSVAPVDPLETLNTLLNGAASSTFKTEKRNTIIDVSFSAGGNCKQLLMVVDTVLQRLVSIQYVLKTAALMGEEVQDNKLPEGYEEYALVKASFNNYKEITSDSSRYDEKEFFYKEGTSLKVTPAYEDYNIFVGSPDL